MAYQLRISKNWAEIEEQLKPLGNKEKGDLFERICEYYLLSEKVYEIKKVYGYGNYPRDVIERLGLVNQIDKGADLVAERENGELWIIQCKFRSNRKEVVTYTELSTALAISDKAEFRLIMANTESLPEIVNARGNIGTVLVDAFTGKDEKFWTGFFEWIDGGKLEKIEINPHDYQVEAINKSKEYFAAKDRGQIVMACGTGKSYVSYWIAEELGAQHVLVMVPSLALLRQLLGDWTTANKGSAFEYLCVCSDASVIESASEDSIDSHLYELDVPVTTKPHEVVRFLERKCDRKMKVIFSTYQSSDVICDALKGLDGFQFDLAVCDEAHRTAGVGGMLFSKVLSDENILCKKRLFLTATPKIYSQGVIKMGEQQDIELCSMDDEGTYGSRIYYLSFGEAIQRKLLTDYRVLAIGVNDSDFHQLLKKDELLLLKDKGGFTASAYDLATKIALVKAAKQYGLTHTITFHARVKSAQRFVEGDHSVKHLFEDKSMFFGHVNGEMSSGERASVLDTFRNASRGVISNARCLTEGVDVKAIDSVYFVDPKYNVIDIVQATGRAVRLYPGKELGYVIVPVLINEDQDEETVLNGSSFNQVWKVIKAMMSQDERLEEIISKVRRYEGEEKQGANREKQSEELYMKLREKAEFIDLPKRFDLEGFEKHLYLRLVDINGRSWDYMFGQLIEWRKRNPDRWPNLVAKDMEESKLARWCGSRRVEYKRHQLGEERIKELEDLGFRWDLLADKWTDGVSALKAWRLKNPDRWPSSSSEDPEEKKSGGWCISRRMEYKRDQLSEERIKELEDLGFQWDLLADQWSDGISALKTWRLKNPDRWPSSFSEDPDQNKLGEWCQRRRADYKSGKLSKEQIKELKDLAFLWNPSTSKWPDGISALKAWRDKNPDRWPSTDSKVPDEKVLGTWCGSRRMEYTKGKISEEKIKELEDIGFSWNPRMDQWTDGVSALKAWRLKNSDRWPSSAAKDPEETRLGRWSVVRRHEYKKGKLSEERIRELEDLGFRWDILADQWTDGISALKAWRLKNPDRWPSSISKEPDERKLNSWCSNRRSDYAKGKLSKEQVKELEDLGFRWDPFIDQWIDGIFALKAWRLKNPDRWPDYGAKDPEENILGSWCHSRRVSYKKGQLGEAKVKELEDLGFRWDLLADQWTDGVSALKAWRLENPDRWPSAASKDSAEKNIGIWCQSKRANNKKGQLGEAKIKELEDLGFRWDLLEDQWIDNISALKLWRLKSPDRWPSSISKEPDERKLNSWCRNNRNNYKKGQLSAAKIKELEDLGFQWDLRRA